MELKFGSVWLLLSCSLQQSLWGILASVPQTKAKKCTHLSSDGEPVKRVRMIHRIPARCSGWDKAWSWISNIDCKTKYKMDYVELPSAVQKVENKDCKEEESATSESSTFSVSDEKFLAIAIGSASIALVILIVIIIISCVKRQQMSRCCMPCMSGPSYTSANDTEQDPADPQHVCNEYVGEGHKLEESQYEEICDPKITKKKLGFSDEPVMRYQNIHERADDSQDDMCVNGVKNHNLNNSTVVPSAPYEEELQQTARKCVNNDYSVMDVKHTNGHVQSAANVVVAANAINHCDDDINKLESQKLSDPNPNHSFKDESAKDGKSDEKDNKKDSENTKKNLSTPKRENLYSKFDDLVPVKGVDSVTAQSPTLSPILPMDSPILDYEEPVSEPISGHSGHVSSHSYENLDPNTQELYVPEDYEPLVYSSELESVPKSVVSTDVDNSVAQCNSDSETNVAEDSVNVIDCSLADNSIISDSNINSSNATHADDGSENDNSATNMLTLKEIDQDIFEPRISELAEDIETES